MGGGERKKSRPFNDSFFEIQLFDFWKLIVFRCGNKDLEDDLQKFQQIPANKQYFAYRKYNQSSEKEREKKVDW